MTVVFAWGRRGCTDKSNKNGIGLPSRARKAQKGLDVFMCVAMPGRVLAVDGTMAEVDFNGNTVKAQAGLVSIQPGDYVLVHAGCILQVLSQEESQMLTELFEEIENI